MSMYRKKPVVIEAMQWDGTAAGALPIINWINDNGREAANYKCTSVPCSGNNDSHGIVIPTLEGKMLASSGDFIIRGVQDEFYPCKPDIFSATYEPA